MFGFALKQTVIDMMSVLIALNKCLSLSWDSGDHLTSANNWKDPERNYLWKQQLDSQCIERVTVFIMCLEEAIRGTKLTKLQ